MKINKNLVLLSAAGAAGLGALIFVLREKQSTTSAANPGIAPNPSVAVPTTTFAVAGVQPAPLSIVGPQTFNFPITRIGSDAPMQASDKCPCETCYTAFTSRVVVTEDYTRRAMAALGRITSSPQPSNLSAQFPPYLYPWFYYNGAKP